MPKKYRKKNLAARKKYEICPVKMYRCLPVTYSTCKPKDTLEKMQPGKKEKNTLLKTNMLFGMTVNNVCGEAVRKLQDPHQHSAIMLNISLHHLHTSTYKP